MMIIVAVMGLSNHLNSRLQQLTPKTWSRDAPAGLERCILSLSRWATTSSDVPVHKAARGRQQLVTV